MLTVGSLFAGVGGFDLGLECAGWTTAWQVEIDDQARQVLRRHFPKAKRYEDVREVGGSNLAPVDLICGGFPCQDLSVAGRREGLAGDRSGLFFEFMRVVGEIAPRWVLIENVPGLLSSNEGRDMGTVLGTLADLGYGWTYRVLDTQFFGPPQRRRRVFIVGHSGGVCPPEILLEPESVPWNPPPSREAGEGAAGGAGQSTSVTGERSHALRGRGCDASEDGTGRGTPIVASETGRGWWTEGPARLRGQPGGMPQNIVAAQCHGTNVGEMGALRRGNGNVTGGVPFVATDYATGEFEEADKARPVTGTSDRSRAGIVLPFDTTQVTSKGNYSRPKPGDPCHPLAKGAHPAAVAFALRGREDGAEAESSGDRTSSIRGEGGSGRDYVTSPVPRRLVPIECEALQGFPRGWTAHGIDEDGERVEMADTPRYRMMGNAISVPVAAWIGARIRRAHEEMLATEEAA